MDEWGEGRLLFVGKDGFDGAVEEASKFEGERETGIKLAGLDGVDGLAGDFEFLGEVGLAPVVFGAEDTESVFHLYLRRMTTPEIPMTIQKERYA
jgi:hypothetical protein